MKRTIIVVFTNQKLSEADIERSKKYSFNISVDVDAKEGDLIETNEYGDTMQVVKVLDNIFTYYNTVTGEMSSEFNSTKQKKIKTITKS